MVNHQTMLVNEPERVSATRPQVQDASLTPRELVQDFEFLNELGRGNQGCVFLARRKSDQCLMAVKQLRIDSVSSWKEYELFEREARVLTSLDIPGVARCYGVQTFLDAQPPCAYLFQEYIEGETLDTLCHRGHRFSNQEVFDIATQLVEILEKLHSHEPPVIHRDLKPSNLIVKSTPNGPKISLIDFGAVANPQIQSGGSTVAGTYGFMPPEQLVGKPSPKSDIYALGAVLVQLLSGVEPVEMPVVDFRLVIEPYLEQQPHEVVELLRGMLAPDQKRRFCDYELLKKAFAAFQKGEKFDTQVDELSLDADENDKLMAVRAFGQNGNALLWQNLSEQTPRAVPKAYQKFRPKKRKATPLYENVKCETNEDRERLNTFETSLNMEKKYKKLTLFFRYLIPTLILNCILIWVFWNEEWLGIGLSVFNPWLFMIFALSYVDQLARAPYMIPWLQLKFPASAKPDDHKNIQNILKNGRKTIARVVSIDYLPAQKHYMDLFYTEDYAQTYVYYHGQPSFRVTYSFNPPDDASETSLIHSIVIHSTPEGQIKPGDPLPILYLIGSNRAHVMSMPYPQPLHNILCEREMYYDSKTMDQ